MQTWNVTHLKHRQKISRRSGRHGTKQIRVNDVQASQKNARAPFEKMTRLNLWHLFLDTHPFVCGYSPSRVNDGLVCEKNDTLDFVAFF
jgi:hypothetical protein